MSPERVVVDGVELRPGSRVRLAPGGRADVLDLTLAGRVAVVEGFDEDFEDQVQVAVTIEDDPGRDLGDARQPGHRFFFSLDEIEPLPDQGRILVAGIGNMFLGDDAFGCELAERLRARELPPGVDVVDFGIRGMDLAYAMQRGYDVVVLLDALPRGERPGTLSLLEPEVDDAAPELDAHGMDPVQVLRLARRLGAEPRRTLVVGCEPATRMTGEEPDLVGELSEPVHAALDPAVKLVENLLEDLMKGR